MRMTRAQQTQYYYVKVVSDILNLFNYLNQALVPRWVKELADLITFRLTKKRLISKAKLHSCFLS